MFWPTFNSMLVDYRTPWRKLGAVGSTYLALAVSAVTAAAVSVLCNPKGKLNLVRADVLNGNIKHLHRQNHGTVNPNIKQVHTLGIHRLVFSSQSDPVAVKHPGRWRCCRGFHLSDTSALGSHDNRIHCSHYIHYWIQIS